MWRKSKMLWCNVGEWTQFSPTATLLKFTTSEYVIYHKKDGTFVLDFTAAWSDGRIGQYPTLDEAKRAAHNHIRAMIVEMNSFLDSVK